MFFQVDFNIVGTHDAYLHFNSHFYVASNKETKLGRAKV